MYLLKLQNAYPTYKICLCIQKKYIYNIENIETTLDQLIGFLFTYDLKSEPRKEPVHQHDVIGTCLPILRK